MAEYKYWILNIEDSGIAWLKINRMDKKNAFNRELVEELYKIYQLLGNNPVIRVLIIDTVDNNFFCSGADIEWFYNVGGKEGTEISIRSHEIFGFAEKLPFPVIAVVRGLCLTAGTEMIMACDMIYAADNAKIGQIETKWGLTPGGGGTQRLTWLVGPLKARELIYTAKVVDATEALKIGLVNDVIPLAEIETYIRNVCKQIIQNSARAIQAAKELINCAIYKSDRGFRLEETIFGADFQSGEPRERFSKFVGKSK
jgi:enoyl-CoA hydratase